jgi:hypothetical protein
MDDEKRREPRLIPAEPEALAAVGDQEGDTDTGNYIAKLANVWAAVRKKSIEQGATA